MGAVFFDRVGALRQAPLFRHLSDGELTGLTQHAAVRRARKHDLLVFEGELGQGLLVLVDGAVRIFREGRDGREQVIRNEHAVSTLNETQLFDDRPHPASISVSEDSLILTLRLNDCRQRIHCNACAIQEALQLLTGRLHNAFDLVDSLSLLTVDQRIAKLLLEQARSSRNRFCADLRGELRLSNQQMGAMVGAVREVVSRSLRKLQTMGLVTCEGRMFMIPSESRMEEFIDSGVLSTIRGRAVSY